MKKLMIAAATAALAGMTFAANVYDYKASVKYVDFKKVTVNRAKVDVKTVKSATLKGYLVTPVDCGCTLASGTTTLDPAFLIVQNNKKYGPKVLPANLLTKYWATSANAKTFEAQGYLFAGVMDQAGNNNCVAIPSNAYAFGDNNSAESEHLFGAYNEQDPGSLHFVEAWLTHAGFGKAVSDKTAGIGCTPDNTDTCLKSLNGSVVGGSFTCKQSAFGEAFLCQGWNEAADEQYQMEVISGTWSIKANAKIEAATLTAAEAALISSMTSPNAATELGYLKACGQKLQKGYVLTQVEAAFASTWF